MIEGKTPKEIRETSHIPEDLTESFRKFENLQHIDIKARGNGSGERGSWDILSHVGLDHGSANGLHMVPEQLQTSTSSTHKDLKAGSWEIYVEKAGIWGEADFTRSGFVDHINTTKDTTDYLWHTTSLFVDENEIFLKNGNKPRLFIEAMRCTTAVAAASRGHPSIIIN